MSARPLVTEVQGLARLSKLPSDSSSVVQCPAPPAPPPPVPVAPPVSPCPPWPPRPPCPPWPPVPPVPAGSRQTKLQVASLTRLPSSHCSPGSSRPLPHSEAPADKVSESVAVAPATSVTDPAPLATAAPPASSPSSAMSSSPAREVGRDSENAVGRPIGAAPARWG